MMILFPLYNNYFKRIGVVAALGFLIIRILQNKFSIFNYIGLKNSSKIGDGIQWLFILSLNAIIYSEEKRESDMIRQHRYFALLASFNLCISILMAYSATCIIGSMESLSHGVYLLMLSAVCIFYILFFNLSILLNKNVSDTDNPPAHLLDSNPQFYIVYSFLLGILLFWVYIY